jgi:serine/threonine-protein kinase
LRTTEAESPPPTVALPAVGAPSDPARFGDYQILEQIGKGGMAVVFKAHRHGEIVALKRPLEAFLSESEFLERFVREAEIGRTLNHPNIIRIFDKGRVGEMPYFTMELVDGETLHALTRREGALSPREASQVVKQVAEALDYSHLKGVIHRDLKPSNIMVLRSGVVKVMDYGIARSARLEALTATGAFLGTPEYVAPETAEGGRTDARSDLYSLGVVFYEILTGVRPFVADTPFATLKKICSEAPTPPSAVRMCPAELEAIVLKLLGKRPEERHASAEELLNDLNDYLNRAS